MLNGEILKQVQQGLVIANVATQSHCLLKTLTR